MSKERTIEFRCNRKSGSQKGRVGDCVAITFAKNGNAHTAVMRGVVKTLTTECGHDLGIIVRREVK